MFGLYRAKFVSNRRADGTRHHTEHLGSPLIFFNNFDPGTAWDRVEMMARPRGPTSTTDGINWREAHLVGSCRCQTSPVDAEFKRELNTHERRRSFAVPAIAGLVDRGPTVPDRRNEARSGSGCGGPRRPLARRPRRPTTKRSRSTRCACRTAEPSRSMKPNSRGRSRRSSARRRRCAWTSRVPPRPSRARSLREAGRGGSGCRSRAFGYPS